MSKIEETRREMYRLLAHLKANPTGVVLMSEFESAMEAHLEVLRQKAKRGARIAELKAWMRAAVRDNQRLRKDRKAFLETQAEHLNEIHRLTALCNNKLSRVIGLS